MSTGRLLLVAPDTDLRRSLAFALEVEGFAVTIRDTPPSRSWLQTNRFDCTVVDQKALTGEQYEAIAFCIKAHPVVLLSNKPHPWLAEWVAEIVDLPLSENAVNTAIRQAMLADA